MKRKIKFRRLHGDSFIYDDEENCCVFWGGLSEKEEESLSQFTGLLDKNGKEIYEGDILKVYDIYNETWSENGAEVVFSSGFYFGYAGGWVLNSGNIIIKIERQNDREIIGNIYENPELINK